MLVSIGPSVSQPHGKLFGTKFHISLVESFMVDLKTILGLSRLNQYFAL